MEKETTESSNKNRLKHEAELRGKRKYERTISTKAAFPLVRYPLPEEDPNEGIIPLIYGGEGVVQEAMSGQGSFEQQQQIYDEQMMMSMDPSMMPDPFGPGPGPGI